MLHGDSFAFSALWSKHVHQRSNSAEMLAVECCWYGVYDQTILGCCQRASLPFGTIRAQNVQILSFFLTFLMIALIWNPTIVTSKLFFQHSDYNLCHVPLVVLAVYSIGTPARRMARDHPCFSRIRATWSSGKALKYRLGSGKCPASQGFLPLSIVYLWLPLGSQQGSLCQLHQPVWTFALT